MEGHLIKCRVAGVRALAKATCSQIVLHEFVYDLLKVRKI